MPRPIDPRGYGAVRAVLLVGLLTVSIALAALPVLAEENPGGTAQGPSPQSSDIEELSYGDGHDGNGGGGAHEGDPDDPLDIGNGEQLELIERTLEISILFGL